MTVQSQVCKDRFSTPVFDTHQDIDMVDDAYCSLHTHLVLKDLK